MPEFRTKVLVVFFVCLAGIALYSLYDRMIARRDHFLKARYEDRPFSELMEKLIGENIFKIEGGKIAIDEKALADRHLGKKTETRVKGSLPFLYAKDGKVLFDNMSVSILYNSAAGEERILRGRFLDRSGVVLAESIISGNERVPKQKRRYSYGPEFYPIIGHSNFTYGKRNLEKELEGYLTGRIHFPVYKTISEPLGEFEIGDDVILTLDSRIQRAAYDLMKDKKGAVVVLDVITGEVLAAVSCPSFDPNTKETAKWREAFMDNQAKPYENRGFSGAYPPGSTFKTVVAAAWIEEGNTEEDHEVICTGKKNGYSISDIHAHGRVDFDRALAVSCNQFFSDIGVMLGQRLAEYAERFGFNGDFDLLPGVKGRNYRSEKSLAFSWREFGQNKDGLRSYSPVDFRRNKKIVAQGAIGQNLIAATPLQMAVVASTIANKGIQMNPSIIREIKRGDGKKTFASQPVSLGKAVKESTAEKLRRLMEEVMEKGTGSGVKKIYREDGRYTTSPVNKNMKPVPVAGKTGTAEVGDKNGNGIIDPDEKPHSWFIGFAPADNPRIAIAVIAENQGFGSLTAAPIAVEVMAEALNQ